LEQHVAARNCTVNVEGRGSKFINESVGKLQNIALTTNPARKQRIGKKREGYEKKFAERKMLILKGERWGGVWG